MLTWKKNIPSKNLLSYFVHRSYLRIQQEPEMRRRYRPCQMAFWDRIQPKAFQKERSHCLAPGSVYECLQRSQHVQHFTVAPGNKCCSALPVFPITKTSYGNELVMTLCYRGFVLHNFCSLVLNLHKTQKVLKCI